MRVPGGGFAVLPLIEKQPGLLPTAEVDVVLDACLPHGDAVRHFSGDHLHPLIEPFERPGARIVAGKDSTRSDLLVEEVDDLRQQPIHALRERLDDEVVAVAIHDERRQQIGLAVNQPIRGRIDAERAPERQRGVDPAFQQLVVGRLLAVRQHADGDLRSIAIQRVSENAAARRANHDAVAARRLDVGHVGAVDPRMTAPKAELATGGEDDGWCHCHVVAFCVVRRASCERSSKLTRTPNARTTHSTIVALCASRSAPIMRGFCSRNI